MITLSGLNNSLLMPEINQLQFIFDTLSVQTTGVSSINFANSTSTGFSFVFSGQNIYLKSSGINKKISSYNLNESINLSGNCLYGNGHNYLDFYVGDIHINSWDEIIPTGLKFVNINVATGDSMVFNLQLFSAPINYNFNMPASYTAFGQTTGVVTTDTNFWILNSNTTFSQSYQPLLSFDTITAPVKTNAPLNLVLNDLDDSSQDYSVNIISNLNSNIGDLVLVGTINRTGNNESSILAFDCLTDNNSISGIFDGSWGNDTFTFNDSTEYLTLNYEYSDMTINGEYDTTQSIMVKFEPYSPLNGQFYTSEYITGFYLTSSGQYSSQPSVVFNNYYYITGISQNYSSLLFSSGCTGNIPVVFTGGGGSGASGYLQLGSITVANLYQAGNHTYFIVTGGVFNNYGTNYTGIASGIIQTGNYGASCYDVPQFYNNNLYSFTSFASTGILSPQATALTGLVLGTTGSMGSFTGYFVTGLDITNIGYGYNASRTPSCAFIRQSGDNLSVNASGTFLMKSSGIYNVNNVWNIYTGWSNSDLSLLQSGFSGVFPTTNRFFSISLQCSGLDNTSQIVNKLSVLPSLGSGIVQYITGTKYFSSDPYFLKKKLNYQLGVLLSGDLSFTTSQTDLDTIYSSFNSNQTIDLGDLNF
jgi:hypothetical protein